MVFRFKSPVWIPVALFFSLSLLFGCSSPAVYSWYPTHSDLDQELLENGRITLFTMPSSMEPEPEPTPGDLIPGRSGETIYSGLDVISLDRFNLLRNRHFALLTNATGVDRRMNRGIDLLRGAGLSPDLLLEPEHGLFGFEEGVRDGSVRVDPKTGQRILSLYSGSREIDCRDLKGIDLIVVDFFHLPVRAYTYASTLIELMEVAVENRIEVMVLDRPNPYGIWRPAGPMLNVDFESFVGKAPVPFLYSMTPGELALFLAYTKFPRLKLSVVKVSGYERIQKDAPLRTSWVNPSPNIPAIDSALVYPGVVLFEGTNVSLGRGTTRPFVYSGAPWMDSDRIVAEMRKLGMVGVEFTQIAFQPTTSLYKGEVCRGVQITPVSTHFDPLRVGYEYMRTIQRIHPEHFRIPGKGESYFMDRLWGDSSYRRAIQADIPYDRFRASWKEDAIRFMELASPVFLYGKPGLD